MIVALHIDSIDFDIGRDLGDLGHQRRMLFVEKHEHFTTRELRLRQVGLVAVRVNHPLPWHRHINISATVP